jgi:hypothetical protein
MDVTMRVRPALTASEYHLALMEAAAARCRVRACPSKGVRTRGAPIIADATTGGTAVRWIPSISLIDAASGRRRTRFPRAHGARTSVVWACAWTGRDR